LTDGLFINNAGAGTRWLQGGPVTYRRARLINMMTALAQGLSVRGDGHYSAQANGHLAIF